jgi:hypothetical protein
MLKEVEFYVPIAVVCCDNLCLIVSRHTRCQKGVQEYKLNVKDIKIHLIGTHLLVALFLLSFSQCMFCLHVSSQEIVKNVINPLNITAQTEVHAHLSLLSPHEFDNCMFLTKALTEPCHLHHPSPAKIA